MIAGLVLAAGESSRMGIDKALLPYRGRTFLETILHNLKEAGVERRAVVLGHHAEEIRRAFKLPDAEIVVNRDYRRGQTSSLQAGLRALMNPDFESIVLCLVDHPAVSAEVIRKLLERSQKSGAPVVIPTFQGQPGHPVLINRTLFQELLDLGPDQGANIVIRKYRDATCFVETDEPGILLDVDDPETYRRLVTSP
jgi:molybdenum cofactor cytidylyltransferase